ncbi:MAG: oligosaccharide flippase family protein [Pseudomonadota bacterium]
MSEANKPSPESGSGRWTLTRGIPVPARLKRFVMGDGIVSEVFANSAKATSVVLTSRVSFNVLRLISNFIMARLLAPEAFGLMAVAFAISSAVEMLSDFGLNANVVRSERGDDPKFLRTVWLMTMARNAFLTLIIWSVALGLWLARDSLPPESTYALAIAPWFVAGAAVEVLIRGFISTSMMLAQREMRFLAPAILRFTAQAITIPVMVVAALLGAGPWALLIGAIFRPLLVVIGSHTVIKGPRMTFEWDQDCFREIFSFGKWIVLASLASLFAVRAGQFIFGYYFTAEEFAFFVIAGIWVVALQGLLETVIRAVCFPAISECMRRDKKTVAGIYKRFRALADVGALGAFVLLMVGNEVFFRYYYPEDYWAAAHFVPLIGLRLFFAPTVLLEQTIISAGDSKRYSGITAFAAVSRVVALPAAYLVFGTDAAVITASLIPVLTLPWTWKVGSRVMKISPVTEGRTLVFAALATVAVLMAP